jgi:hypothetical protein
MDDTPSWHIVGDWFDNCSCAVPCPCTFAQAPDYGFCESVLFWHVREGHYGDVKLDNLSFVRVGRWEGDLRARKATGVAGLYIDDHADDRQMEALPAIIGGRAGGFPGWVTNASRAAGRAAASSGPKSRMRLPPISAIGESRSSAGSRLGPRRSSGRPARPGSIRS